MLVDYPVKTIEDTIDDFHTLRTNAWIGTIKANVGTSVEYEIDKTKCIGCSLCSRVCPVKAISGEIKKPFVIDQNICVKCGKCYNSCRFNAIKRG